MKRIVICADGTWNIRDQLDKKTKTRRPTNVTKVARGILPRAGNVDQVVFYHEGVGTSGGMDKLTGGAFGDGIENNIRELYRSIMYNYEPGDELFFFGFSRGAFTVRTLAGFMNAVGLLTKGDDYWLPEIYGCYQKGKRPGSPEWTQATHRFEHASMTTMYRLMGENVRPIGAHGPDERLHRAAVDRRQLASCAYAPPNLDEYRTKNPDVAPYATTRAPCGTPCSA